MLNLIARDFSPVLSNEAANLLKKGSMEPNVSQLMLLKNDISLGKDSSQK